METTRNKLPERIKLYFDKLATYLETKLYFFGSVQRLDYLKNESDIDIAIFTDNMEYMILKLQGFLNVDRTRIKRFVSKEQIKNHLHYGYKVIYEGDDIDVTYEIVMYGLKFKQEMLDFYVNVNNIPIFASFVLLLLKYLKCYYIISNRTYYQAKKKIFLLVIPNQCNLIVLD
jgi:predicted nucleotidyltransferase